MDCCVVFYNLVQGSKHSIIDIRKNSKIPKRRHGTKSVACYKRYWTLIDLHQPCCTVNINISDTIKWLSKNWFDAFKSKSIYSSSKAKDCDSSMSGGWVLMTSIVCSCFNSFIFFWLIFSEVYSLALIFIYFFYFYFIVLSTWNQKQASILWVQVWKWSVYLNFHNSTTKYITVYFNYSWNSSWIFLLVICMHSFFEKVLCAVSFSFHLLASFLFSFLPLFNLGGIFPLKKKK